MSRTVARTSRLARAGALALAAVVVLGGCSTTEDNAREIRDVIVARAPGVEEAVVRNHKDIFVDNIIVRLSMPTTTDEDDDALVAAIDATLDATWTTSRTEPSNVTIEVTLAPMQDGARYGDKGSIELEDRGIDEALGLDGAVYRDSIRVNTEELHALYGARGKS